MLKKLQMKKRKMIYVLGSITSAFYLIMVQIHAESAGDKMTNVFTQAGEKTKSLGNTIGGAIAGCISVVCGIAALFIVGKGAYKSWKNHGVESVFEESGTAIGTLAIVAIIAGIVSATFFNV